MSAYLLESAASTLRGEIQREIDWYASKQFIVVNPYQHSHIAGMRRALSILEDMMYEDMQMRIETSCA